ncbi:MAG: Glyoxalase/bleomycin resistance protein/dioxygenase [Bacteroidetes bacterium]|nr:Glyoxalase/bleomycin resistance protein/dioxygenase [Bacteroidota bacterium]
MTEPSTRIPSETHIGSLDLRISNLDRALAFYCGLLGFREIGRDGSAVRLSASGGEPYHIALTELRSAKQKPHRSTGLFHVAFLYPSRKTLAIALSRLTEREFPLQGAADHGVSEALYLADPDGNGIELYVDRPRSEWPMQGTQLAMVTEPLNVQSLLDEVDSYQWNGIHPETRIGHVHLQVSNLVKSREFYCDVLGFEITQSSYPGALFIASGGYHHHIGMNVWSSFGAPPPPPDAVGLISFRIVTSGGYLPQVASRLDRLAFAFEKQADASNHSSLRIVDPDRITADVTSGS